MGALSPTHWLIIVGVLVLLFGAKRLPDAARSLGRSARILKAEVHQAGAEGAPSESPQATPSHETAATAPIVEGAAVPALSDSAPVVPPPSARTSA